MLIDTHAHLNFPDFENDLSQVINNSIKNGVGKIICASANLAHSTKAIEIAKKYPGIVYASVGIHPQQTDPENDDSSINQIKKLGKLATQQEVVAIGECGLDSSKAPAPEKTRGFKKQLFLFEKQINLALKLGLPLIVHSRQTFNETFEVLQKYFLSSGRKLRGVFHCYSSGKSEVKKVEAINFYFGLDGNLTYDLGLQNVAKIIPLEKIVLETDSPFLAPIPYRGLRNEAEQAYSWRNEPKNVKIIAELLANIKGVSLQEIIQKTTKNAQDLFKI